MDTLCDDCSTPIPLEESNTCDNCGLTVCNDCYAMNHNPCEDE